MSNRRIFESPWVSRVFHDMERKDVQNWLRHFKRVAALNQWDDGAKLGQALLPRGWGAYVVSEPRGATDIVPRIMS